MIPGVFIVVDDMIIAASSREEHDHILKKVFQRENNVKFNIKKIKIRVDVVLYVGYIISKDDIKVDPEKVKAIVHMAEPGNKEELRRFLGIITYLSRYIPKLSVLNAPLRKLLKEDVEWT